MSTSHHVAKLPAPMAIMEDIGKEATCAGSSGAPKIFRLLGEDPVDQRLHVIGAGFDRGMLLACGDLRRKLSLSVRLAFVFVPGSHVLERSARHDPAAVQKIEPAAVEIRRSALIGCAAPSTFDLIEAAESYPAFLPWCANAVILARDDSVVTARITVNFHGLRFDLTTPNPKRRPHWMGIHLERGPFRRFEGEWQVVALSPEACKIEFALRYQFDHALVGKLAEGVFDGIADTLVDAFARRAEHVLDRTGPSNGRDPHPTPGRMP